jgi:DNA-binding CsgD family transcriptional regulator
MLDEGIAYCEERDLNSWTAYMSSWKARFLLETGKWEEADQLATKLIAQENQPAVVMITALVVAASVRIRKGKPDALPLLASAKELALGAQELQRLGPVIVAYLEYEWITGERLLTSETLDEVKELAKQTGTVYENNEFDGWLMKARGQSWGLNETLALYDVRTVMAAVQAAELWEHQGCSYEQALCLLEGGDADKRKALTIFHALGASAVCEKLKAEMHVQGVKGVPRGMRKSTQSNPALLTDREMGVLELLKEGLQNKEIAAKLYISAKTVDHHLSSILFKLDAKSRVKAVQEALRLKILK